MEKKVKEIRKMVEEVGEKHGTVKGPLIQRKNYKEGIKIKQDMQKKNKLPWKEINQSGGNFA